MGNKGTKTTEPEQRNRQPTTASAPSKPIESAQPQQPVVAQEPAPIIPQPHPINFYEATAVVVQFVAVAGLPTQFGDEELQRLREALAEVEEGTKELHSQSKILKKWVAGLQPTKAAQILTRANAIRGSVECISRFLATITSGEEISNQFVRGQTLNPNAQIITEKRRHLLNCTQAFLGDVLNFYFACEDALVDSDEQADITAQVQRTARVMKTVLDIATSTRPLDEERSTYGVMFDPGSALFRASLQFTLEALKLERMANRAGFRKRHVEVQKDISECGSFIVKAARVLGSYGKRLRDARDNPSSVVHSFDIERTRSDLVSLSRLVLQKFKALQSYLATPDAGTAASAQASTFLTMALVDAYKVLYAGAVKELADAIDRYMQAHQPEVSTPPSAGEIRVPVPADQFLIELAHDIALHMGKMRDNFVCADSLQLMEIVLGVADRVARLLHHCLGEVQAAADALGGLLKHHVMLTLQTVLHYSMQTQLIACLKVMGYPMLVEEPSLLVAFRGLASSMIVLLGVLPFVEAPDVFPAAGDVETSTEKPTTGPLDDKAARTTLDPIAELLVATGAPAPSTNRVPAAPTRMPGTAPILLSISEATEILLDYGRPKPKEIEPPQPIEQERVVESPAEPNPRRASTAPAVTASTSAPAATAKPPTPVVTATPATANAPKGSRQLVNELDEWEALERMKQEEERRRGSMRGVSPQQQPQTTTATPVATAVAEDRRQREEQEKKRREEEAAAERKRKEEAERAAKPPPKKPVYDGPTPPVTSEDIDKFKKYMIAKYEYEQWENAEILRKRKEAAAAGK